MKELKISATINENGLVGLDMKGEADARGLAVGLNRLIREISLKTLETDTAGTIAMNMTIVNNILEIFKADKDLRKKVIDSVLNNIGDGKWKN